MPSPPSSILPHPLASDPALPQPIAPHFTPSHANRGGGNHRPIPRGCRPADLPGRRARPPRAPASLRRPDSPASRHLAESFTIAPARERQRRRIGKAAANALCRGPSNSAALATGRPAFLPRAKSGWLRALLVKASRSYYWLLCLYPPSDRPVTQILVPALLVAEAGQSAQRAVPLWYGWLRRGVVCPATTYVRGTDLLLGRAKGTVQRSQN